MLNVALEKGVTQLTSETRRKVRVGGIQIGIASPISNTIRDVEADTSSTQL